MPKLQHINDRDKQVRIVQFGNGQPPCILPARILAIFMRGARVVFDGPTVPAGGAYVHLALGYPTRVIFTYGTVTDVGPSAYGPHTAWIQFDEYCGGEPLHKARDLIRALR
jgi:hypothetical protein